MFDKWKAVTSSKGGRDYATYHYAVKVSLVGDNPYNPKNLNKLAQKEGQRSSVHPFFYPPPSLLSMLWLSPFALLKGYRVFFWINQLLLILTIINVWKWLKVPILWLIALAIFLSPIADTIKMGQANLLVLWLLSVALRRGSGFALGLASMTKMSPALLFFQWIAMKRWRPVLICAFSVPVFSLVSLPLVGFEEQLEFYTVVLPQFSNGSYLGLSIPINIPANHSIADIFNQLWPSGNSKQLSHIAQRLSMFLNLSLFTVLIVLSNSWKNIVSERCLQGAMICLMLVFPVYCYEHHLALLFIPSAILLSTFQKSILPKYGYYCAALAYFFAAWPLFLLRRTQRSLDGVHWLLQESKFFAIIAIALLSVWAAYRAHLSERALEKVS